MQEFFAKLYEWFGLLPIYSRDMAEHLRGWDYACSGYFALPQYVYVGWAMIIVTTVIFALQYDLINSKRFPGPRHWGLAAFMIVIINFLVAFAVPFISIETKSYCLHFKLSVADCIGFAISNAVWSFLLFVILSAIQEIRTLIVNRRKT